jgi:hypothetical protein
MSAPSKSVQNRESARVAALTTQNHRSTTVILSTMRCFEDEAGAFRRRKTVNWGILLLATPAPLTMIGRGNALE